MEKIHKDILIGALLGDASINKPNNTKSARIQISHSIKQTEWVWYKYQMIKDLVSTPPRARTEIKYPVIYFNTKTLSEIYELYELFISYGRKGVPQNIGELLSPIGLAVWFGDDGTSSMSKAPRLKNPKRHGFFCTDSFTEEEVNILRRALLDKFQIETTLWSPPSANGRCRIYIRTKSFQTITNIIEPYLPPTMKYKVVGY